MSTVAEVRDRERAEREARAQREREQLGLAPVATSLRYAAYALEVADERLRAALRYADRPEQVDRFEDALQHVLAARKGLGGPPPWVESLAPPRSRTGSQSDSHARRGEHLKPDH